MKLRQRKTGDEQCLFIFHLVAYSVLFLLLPFFFFYLVCFVICQMLSIWLQQAIYRFPLHPLTRTVAKRACLNEQSQRK
jgi:hypothetical protein